MTPRIARWYGAFTGGRSRPDGSVASLHAMTGQHESADRLMVALRDGNAVVRVMGRGTHVVSTALKDFLGGAAAAGATRVVVDLAWCETMDSTFLGVLAGVAIRLRPTGGAVVLLNLSGRVRHLVETLGLDLLVACHASDDTPADLAPALAPDPDMGSLDAGEASRAAETILEAHETLVTAVPSNLDRFKDVLQFLREDMKRKGGGN